MMWTRFRKPGDAPGPERAAALQHRLRGVRHVMECVEAEDAVDACVRKIDPTAIEQQKTRRRLISYWWQPLLEVPSQFQRTRRDVKRDCRAAKLRQAPRSPTGASTEVEHVQ